LWVGFAKIRNSVLGAKTVRNPETPGIYPDTPEISYPETPSINPDIPVCQNCEHRVVLGSGACVRVRIISKLQSYCMHSYIIMHTYSSSGIVGRI